MVPGIRTRQLGAESRCDLVASSVAGHPPPLQQPRGRGMGGGVPPRRALCPTVGPETRALCRVGKREGAEAGLRQRHLSGPPSEVPSLGLLRGFHPQPLFALHMDRQPKPHEPMARSGGHMAKGAQDLERFLKGCVRTSSWAWSWARASRGPWSWR
jgi:hypothetical protein